MTQSSEIRSTTLAPINRIEREDDNNYWVSGFPYNNDISAELRQSNVNGKSLILIQFGNLK